MLKETGKKKMQLKLNLDGNKKSRYKGEQLLKRKLFI